MRYHLLPITNYRHLERDLYHETEFFNSSINNPTTELIKKHITSLVSDAREFHNIADRCIKRDIEAFDYLKRPERNRTRNKKVYYLFDNDSMDNLKKILKVGDTLVLHGEGLPFLIGLKSCSPFDLDATKLAFQLSSYQITDSINIELLACNSATDYTTEDGYKFNFARDTSEALHYLYGYQDITVSGYSGFIVDKENGKFSVSKTIGAENRGDNMSLSSAKFDYKNGHKVQISKKELDLSAFAFDWAKSYIETAKHGKLEVNTKKLIGEELENQMLMLASKSFFSKISELENSGTQITNLETMIKTQY